MDQVMVDKLGAADLLNASSFFGALVLAFVGANVFVQQLLGTALTFHERYSDLRYA